MHYTVCRYNALTLWGRVTHICVCNLTIIDSDNGLSPVRRQAIIWTNASILFFWTPGNKLQRNINRNSYISIKRNPFQYVVWNMAAVLSRIQCVNELKFLPKVIHLTLMKWNETYQKISNIGRTKSQNLNVSCLVLQLSLPNPLKPGFKSTMKM